MALRISDVIANCLLQLAWRFGMLHLVYAKNDLSVWEADSFTLPLWLMEEMACTSSFFAPFQFIWDLWLQLWYYFSFCNVNQLLTVVNHLVAMVMHRNKLIKYKKNEQKFILLLSIQNHREQSSKKAIFLPEMQEWKFKKRQNLNKITQLLCVTHQMCNSRIF